MSSSTATAHEISRVGLYGLPEFADASGISSGSIDGIPGALYAYGLSGRKLGGDGSLTYGDAAWGTNLATGETFRIGLWDKPGSGTTEFTSASGSQSSYIYGFGATQPTLSGYIVGTSTRHNGLNPADTTPYFNGSGAWVANAFTGVTTRIGLWGGEFGDIRQHSGITSLTESGWITGFSYRQNSAYDQDNNRGAWIANAATGETVRVGYWDATDSASSTFTSSEGKQYSTVRAVDSAGYAIGSSWIYNGSQTQTGQATWIANTGQRTETNGYETRRVGLYQGSEYTAASGAQFSEFYNRTESGYVTGYSTHTTGGALDDYNRAMWVTSTHTGETLRVGLWKEEDWGDEFTSLEGRQFSDTNATLGSVSENGVVIGQSVRFLGLAGEAYARYGHAAWVANADTGVTRRVGFREGAEFTSNKDKQNSEIQPASLGNVDRTGYVYGYSERYNGKAIQLGQAAWIANVNTGETIRMGFWDESGSGAYTKNAGSGSGSYGTQYSLVRSSNASGQFVGDSTIYGATTGVEGNAMWVASTTDPTARRIGLYEGPEFTLADGIQDSRYENLLGIASGYVAGTSIRAAGGAATWVANANTAQTVRVGLYQDPQFTSATGAQGSAFWTSPNVHAADLFKQRERVLGNSVTYDNNGENLGNASWIARADTGATTRLGLWDKDGGNIYTRSDGKQITHIGGASVAAGYVWGYSYRYNGNYTTSNEGQTAWIFNIDSEIQVSFAFSISDTGRSYSEVKGMSDDGIAWGVYYTYNGNTYVDTRAFFWGEEFGAVDVNELLAAELAAGGWASLSTIDSILTGADGLFTITGTGLMLNGDNGLFLATIEIPNIGETSLGRGYLGSAIPEPATWALILSLGSALAAISYRIRQRWR